MNKLFLFLLLFTCTLQKANSQFTITGPNPDQVCLGDTAMFQVTVSPTPDSLRWQYADSQNGQWKTPMAGIDRIDTTLIRIYDAQSYDQKFFRIIVWLGGSIVDSSEGASLKVNPLPIAMITPNGPITFCQGESVTLMASPIGSYLWSNGEVIQNIAVSMSNNYLVTVTDGNGCSSASAITTVIVHPLPIAIITPSGPTTFCQGNSISLSVSPSSSYLWSNGELGQSISVSISDIYSVTVSDVNDCSASSATMVTVNPLPTAIISPGGPTTFCQGGSVILTASSASSYLWNNGEILQSITVLTPGNYWVSVTNEFGCSSNSSPIPITVNPNPNAEFVTTPSDLANTNIDVNQSIYFTDSSNVGSIVSPIVDWYWVFGEANDAMPENDFSHQAYRVVQVKYLKSGSKKAVLRILDSAGCENKDSIGFQVLSDSIPSVSITPIMLPICLGDPLIIEVKVETLDKPNYKVLPIIEPTFVSGSGMIIPLSIITNSDEIYTRQFQIIFDQSGSYDIKAKGSQQNKSTGAIVDGFQTRKFGSGSIVPHVSSLVSSSDFLCRGDSINIDLFIEPQEDAEIIYQINTGSQILAVAENGHTKIENIIAQTGSDEIVIKVISIDLNNGCKNNAPNFSISIPVRPKPYLEFDNPKVVCLESKDTIFVTGAESYIWKLQGNEVSTDSFLIIPTIEARLLQYFITGESAGCSSDTSVTVEVKDPPSPVISGDTSVCTGQVVIYTSNSSAAILKWKALNGEIPGPDNEVTVKVKWLDSGSLKLIQEIGGCIDSISRIINVGAGESPPYDSLEYLSGGGILLYPNPNLIPGLCYNWYKDGQLLTDHFQGYVVGTNLSESELKRYSVKVYYCGQDTGCAQLITYRDIQEFSTPTDFYIQTIPNPNSGEFSIKYDILDAGDYALIIFNSSGQLIRKESILLEDQEGKLNLSLPNAISGLYFIKLINTQTGDYQVVPVSIFK